MENTKPKPHPHADLIKAWADGAHIEYFDEKRNVWDDCLLNAPTWGKDIKYRIKPEEPWKPGEDDMFYSVKVIRSVIDIDNDVWSGGFTYEKILKNGNVFRTREEAEAAAERVKAAMKGDDVSKKDAEIKKLTDELEKLKIHCKNLQITKDQLIASRAEMDALTEGETALIKAMRKVWTKEIPEYGQSVLAEYGQSVLVYNKEGSMQMTPANLCVAFITDGLISDIGTEDAIIDALKQIKKEQKLLK